MTAAKGPVYNLTIRTMIEIGFEPKPTPGLLLPESDSALYWRLPSWPEDVFVSVWVQEQSEEHPTWTPWARIQVHRKGTAHLHLDLGFQKRVEFNGLNDRGAKREFLEFVVNAPAYAAAWSATRDENGNPANFV